MVPLKNTIPEPQFQDLLTVGSWGGGALALGYTYLKSMFASKRKLEREILQRENNQIIADITNTLKTISDNQIEMKRENRDNFRETFSRINALEKFKAKIDALHPTNHPGQELHAE